MTEPDKKTSFWATLPGILTGLAAMITALVGLYVGILRNPPVPGVDLTPPPQMATAGPRDWPPVLEETFTGSAEGWPQGRFNNDASELVVVGGNYRLEIIADPWHEWAVAPYGPLVDFSAAVDVEFVAMPGPAPIAAGIVFGLAEGRRYVFWISTDGNFSLWTNAGDRDIVPWTATKLNATGSNRLEVSAWDQQIELRVNGEFVGAYRDSGFSGGRIGLAVIGWDGAAVVDFDNFELRRGP